MDAVKFFKEADRMCKSFYECTSCPAFSEKKGTCGIFDIFNFHTEFREEVVYAVEKWSENHQAKTRQSEFLKMFPNAEIMETGSLAICPINIDDKCGVDCGKDCFICKKEYWLAEVE